MRETYAQSSGKIDSLRAILSKLPPEGRTFGSDTMRVRVLYEIGRASINPDSSIKYLTESLNKSIKFNNLIYCQKSSFAIGKKNKIKGTYLEAVDFFYKSLSYAEKINDNYKKAISYQEIADSFIWLNQPKKSQTLYQEALKLYKFLHLYEDYADCLNNLAITYHDIGQYNKSIELLEECLTYEPYIKGKQSIPSFYANIGSAYREQKKYKKALFYYKKSLQLQVKTGDYDKSSYAFLLLEMAINYLLQDDLANAISYANQSKKINESLPNGVRYNPDEILYKAYKKQKKYNLSLTHLELSIDAKAKATAQDFAKRINALQYEYDNQKKELEIYSLNTNLEKQQLLKKFYITGIIFLLLFGIWFWINNQKLKSQNNQIEEQKKHILKVNENLDNFNKLLEKKVGERTIELSQANEELLQKNKEITQALVKGQSIERQRVASELHDNLGGTLTAIKWQLAVLDFENLSQTEQKIYDSIMEMLQNAYADVRHISHNLLPSEFEEKGLIGAIQKLCDDINKSQRLEMSFSFNSNLENIEEKITLELYSICMEAINNILKHSKATKAEIVITKEEYQLQLIIKDNGIGIDSNIPKNGKGFKNFQTRLETINGVFNISSSNGTILSVKVPLSIKD